MLEEVHITVLLVQKRTYNFIGSFNSLFIKSLLFKEYILLTLFSISLFTINSLTSTHINYIPDAAHNATPPTIYLENIDGDFIYFYFNFTSHDEFYPDHNGTAFFSILLDEDSKKLMKDDSVKYLLNDLEYHDDLDIESKKTKNWVNVKKTSKDDMEYFYKITREEEKSLYLRVGTNKVKKGQITVTNVDKIPSGNSIAGNIQISKLLWIFFLLLNIW